MIDKRERKAEFNTLADGGCVILNLHSVLVISCVCALVCELSLAFHLWSAIARSSCRLSPRRAACCPLEATR
jgi:hypothetical protein